jgi:N-acetylgalactosamine-6-sulfatase
MKRTLTSLLAVFILPVSVRCAPETQDSSRPNVLFIYMDDWGWGDLSCHGHPNFKTPNVDRLAREGIDFQQFNVVSPVCSPSRVGAITGRFPSRYSIRHALATVEENRQYGQCDWLDPQAITTARLFQQAGYATGHFGKWHLGKGNELSTALYGYDESSTWGGPAIGGKEDEVDRHGVYDRTVEFIRAHKEGPFYVELWPHETHAPQVPTEQSMREYAHLDERHRPYAASIADGDKGIGRVLNALEELGLERNTIVMFSSDNGPEVSRNRKEIRGGYGTYYSTGSTGGLRGWKRSLFEGGVRVPMIVRWTGHAPAGIKNEATVLTAVDLLPTLCFAAGVSLPKGYEADGENLLDAFLGKPVTRTKPVFWECADVASGGDYWPRVAVRDGDWKLLMDRQGGRRELYHLSEDRAEAREVGAAHPEIVDRLTRLAMEWRATLPKQPNPAFCATQTPKRPKLREKSKANP